MIAPEKPLTRSDCAYAIANDIERPPRQILLDAAALLGEADADTYGAGSALEAFEGKIAAVLGKEAAVFMPSGTMAQQIALRIVADRTGVRAFAAHPTNHVVLHERDGYARLHALHFVPVGAAGALIRPEDVAQLREPIGTLLLELPQREIGGELPAWDDLLATAAQARALAAHLHLDGARLWECGPAYAPRPYAEIAGLFDSVYVSFYKGLGGLAGAMLAGSAPFIDEARIWLRRHGGNLRTLFPYAAVAEQSFDARLGRMARYHEAALSLARALAAYPGVRVRPNPPPTNMLHAFITADAETLLARAQRIAREHGIWTVGRVAAAAVPGVVCWEISCGEAIVALGDARLRVALDALLSV